MSFEPWIAPDHPDVVWFRGADAIGFLNDLVSQEVASMEVGEVRRSLFLRPKGKLDQILWVLRGDGEVGLVAEEGRGAELAASIGRFRIRVDVDITQETQPTWVIIGSTEFDPGRWRPFDGGLSADVSWAGVSRTLIVGNRPTVAEGEAGEYERLRILAGEPRWGIDVDEKTIPQEAGLVSVSVDFKKGCYLGQELVARIHNRGHVNRHLRILELDNAADAGAAITSGENEVGVLTSVVDRVGLGLVRREIEPGSSVQVGAATAKVLAVPSKPQT
ncbi:MAG: hypothetical protein U9N56_01210 [Actinomycetota bacterium]|nr:hypothetical protein [Actinomycetota bacterium]